MVWHSFDAATFEIGRNEIDAHPGLWVYSAERSIVDAYRLAHLEGLDTAHEALRRWTHHPDSSPATLLRTAERFPRRWRLFVTPCGCCCEPYPAARHSRWRARHDMRARRATCGARSAVTVTGTAAAAVVHD